MLARWQCVASHELPGFSTYTILLGAAKSGGNAAALLDISGITWSYKPLTQLSVHTTNACC